MKQFFRTVGGKTICFIACLLSLCILILSVTGALYFIYGDFYTQSEETVYADILRNQFYSEGVSVIHTAEDSPSTPAVVEAYGDYDFTLTDESGKVLAISREALINSRTEFPHELLYGVIRLEDGNLEIFGTDQVIYNMDVEYLTFHFDMTPGGAEEATYAFTTQLVHIAFSLRYWIYGIILLSLLFVVASFIALMCISGRRPDTEEVSPGPLNRVPFDLLVTAAALFAGFVFVLADSFYYNDVLVVIILLAGAVALACIGLGLCMSFAARIKQKTLLKNTAICFCLRYIWKFLRFCGRLLRKSFRLFGCIPLVWRTALILSGVILLEYIMLLLCWWETDVLMFFWFLSRLVIIPAVLYLAIMLRKLQKGGEALASGNLRYYTDTKGLFWDFKRHGENLNSIAVGMNAAVEERLKSERMKTELITNVSHDIKTPLTSIVNYAGLIGKEPCDNQKITEYSQVLTRQSERLRRLIEDLVEVSKASTGNLEVNLAPCDAAVFLSQASGEYEQKLKDAGLTLVTKQPEEPIRILADGRRMWRIFDNLMNNICKYAQTGTRVYLTLEPMGDSAVISFKNTSRQELDIREEELLERFVRGDSSRNTEGNGLGLSIARSMAELQKGELRLFIDGDLFKAILIFPKL